MHKRALAFAAVLGAACADGVPVEPPAATPQVEAAQTDAAEETAAEETGAAPEPQPNGRLELEPLSDDERSGFDVTRAPRIGAHRPLPQPLPGVWSRDEDGPVWRLTLRSPGAVALRLHFTEFEAEGGTVRVFEPDEKRRPAGERRYGHAGPSGDGEFWSDVLEGDAAVVEFRPAGARPETLPFRLEEISHLWRSPLDAF